MATAVRIPKATISMEEAVVLRWFKSEGEKVAKDDLLFEIETDKAVLEVPAPADGTLIRIAVSAGSARVEQVVGWIGQAGETLVEAEPDSQPGHRIVATPAARRRAAELKIDLSKVTGSGPGGRITDEDVVRTRPTNPRGALVQKVTSAWQSIPHIHIAREMDAAALAEAHNQHADASVTDLVLYALSRMLPDFDLLAPSGNTSIALAVDTPRGVVAPVIANTAELDLDAISRKRRALSAAARDHRLRPDELEGGAITLSNLGMADVDFFAPIINAPQSAILALGAMRQKPVVVERSLAIGWRMWVNLAVDHRICDGAYAARFLTEFSRRLGTLPSELGQNSL